MVRCHSAKPNGMPHRTGGKPGTGADFRSRVFSRFSNDRETARVYPKMQAQMPTSEIRKLQIADQFISKTAVTTK